MTIHCDLTNIIFYTNFFFTNYIQTYKYYIQVGFLMEFFKRKSLKIKESLKQGILKRNVLKIKES